MNQRIQYDHPLCRLYCSDAGTDQRWRWESLDRKVRSRAIFASIYECAQDAKAAGFSVDLATVAIAEE